MALPEKSTFCTPFRDSVRPSRVRVRGSALRFLKNEKNVFFIPYNSASECAGFSLTTCTPLLFFAKIGVFQLSPIFRHHIISHILQKCPKFAKIGGFRARISNLPDSAKMPLSRLRFRCRITVLLFRTCASRRVGTHSGPKSVRRPRSGTREPPPQKSLKNGIF